MHKIKAFVPHLFTLANLFCGCLGIIYAFAWKLDGAACMVFLAAFLDFFDGLFARLLRVPSELGKQLDSLADVVSFGVLPGMVIFHWLTYLAWSQPSDDIGLWGANRPIQHFPAPWYCYTALLIPLFSCYRLAKFNLDTRQSHGFLGLPTPANAIFFVSLVLIGSKVNLAGRFEVPDGDVFSFAIHPPMTGPGAFLDDNTTFSNDRFLNPWLTLKLAPLLHNLWVMAGLVGLFCLLLVSELPLFALKFKNFGWKDNKIRYLFLACSALLLICFLLTAIPFIVILYLLMSIIGNTSKITV